MTSGGDNSRRLFPSHWSSQISEHMAIGEHLSLPLKLRLGFRLRRLGGGNIYIPEGDDQKGCLQERGDVCRDDVHSGFTRESFISNAPHRWLLALAELRGLFFFSMPILRSPLEPLTLS